MDNQRQSLDALLQLNQDFGVPDQLFDDSDIGGDDDMYNSVEIETSKNDGCKIENEFNDGDSVVLSQSSSKPSGYHPASSPVTIDNSVNNQSGIPSHTVVHQTVENHLPAIASSTNKMSPISTPITTQSPLITQPILPTAIPPKKAPLKMLTVPVNSDVITQGNSQVLLIPMGGMDCSKLESSLKVPLGQKLVIIKPQEILKTIEAKKVQQNLPVAGLAPGQDKNAAMSQQAILLQGTSTGGYQPIQVRQVTSLPVQKGVVKVAPKLPHNNQGPYTQQNVPIQHVRVKMPTASGVRTVQPKTVGNNSSIARPTGQAIIPSVSTAVRSKVVKNQLLKPASQIGKVNASVVTIQPKFPTNTANLTAIAQGIVQTPVPLSSQTSLGNVNNVTVAAVTTMQTTLTNPQTGLATSQTGLTTSQTGLKTATEQQSTTLKQSTSTVSHSTQSEVKPNLYQRLKKKVARSNEGTSTIFQSSTPNVTALQILAQEVKAPISHPSQKIQDSSVKQNSPSQKVITHVLLPSQETAKTAKTSFTSEKPDAVIQVSGNVEQHVTNAKVVNGTESLLASSGDLSQGEESNSKISPQVAQIKMEDSGKVASTSTESPASRSEEPNWPSIAEHENTVNNVVVRKRGRPRKKSTEKLATNTQVVKKTTLEVRVSGPTLKHELDRQGSGVRLKTVKPGEHQMRVVKHKRVSNTNPWTCALCGKTSFENSLGCLYGPYDGESDADDIDRGEPQEKRRRNSNEEGSLRIGDELWFHGECMVWSPGVYVLGDTLAGYKQVVSDAQSRMCNFCGVFGATLVCLHRACKKQYHFFCAKKNGCVFEESNYTIMCGNHKK